MSTLPATGPPSPSLGDAINIATRSVHAKLNKLILLRLPLAVPPHSPTPSTYVTGLLYFAPIYTAFERLWQHALDEKAAGVACPEENEPNEPVEPTSTPAATLSVADRVHATERPSVCCRRREILQYMKIPGLARSNRLRADIKALTGWTDEVVEEQIRVATNTGRLNDFISHIERSVTTNSHVLIAYAWVLYMALFSGGRFIRASLESLGDDFWKRLPTPVRPNMIECSPSKSQAEIAIAPTYSDESHLESAYLGAVPLAPARHHWTHRLPLDFFHFPTPRDGEDLKQEFKKRLAETETQLTATERDDIIKEAASIFDNMALLVEQLDAICDTPTEDQSTANSWTNYLTPRLGTRLQDSIAVAKIRGLKKKSGTGEGDGSSESEGTRTESSDSTSGGEDSTSDIEGKNIEDQNHRLQHRSDSPRAVHFGTTLPRPKKLDTAQRHHFSTDGALDVCPVALSGLEKRQSTTNVSRLPDSLLLLGFLLVTLGFVYIRSGGS